MRLILGFIRLALFGFLIFAVRLGFEYFVARSRSDWTAGVALAVAFCSTFIAYLTLIDRQTLQRMIVGLEKLARTDDLTGLANDRAFRETFERRGSGLILFDLDHFKTFNDTHGHPAGDEVLRELGSILQGEPTVYRLGGDEFAIVLADTDVSLSIALAEQFRARIRDHPWPLRPITASFGVAALPATYDAKLLRDRADQALYQAKREGGDKVCVYSDANVG